MKIHNFEEFLNESEEMSNIGAIHAGCAADRLSKWQQENKNTPVKAGDNIKMAFQDGDMTEHMWVLIDKVIDKDTFEGVLNSDPIAVNTIKSGDRVKVNRIDISQIESPIN